MLIPPDFDFKQPDYAAVFRRRSEALGRIRSGEVDISLLKAFYRDNPAQFITDWGVTVDPRNVERGLPSLVPFILFPRQVEWVDFTIKNWRDGEYGATEKCRDMGISWLSIALSCTLCLHQEGMAIGFGSKKEELVDRIGDPKALLPKARMFMSHLPKEFRGGWDAAKHAPHMRIIFPETESIIAGEAGDSIGRGDRKSIYFVDEAAHLERPHLTDASLSNTTNCRQDISSVNGLATTFQQRVMSGKHRVFQFDWSEDPRKDQAWFDKKRDELDPVVFAQEILRDASAAIEGVLIPQLWVRSAIDAHVKLGILPSGDKFGALDVADEGRDKNAFCGAYGVVLDHIEEWSGQGGDIFQTTQKAFLLCDTLGYRGFKYDADGLGAGVRGDARMINAERTAKLPVEDFRGSEAVANPDGEVVEGRTNKDFFANRKAQAWWSLRDRFKRTHRWVSEGIPCDPDEIISISSEAGDYRKLCSELSQPTYAINLAGKIVIDKAPDGMKSPNMADAVMIRFSNVRRAQMRINLNSLAHV